MKPITFENLRRLMGGGRKKKDKESSFKRSDSFKRISIRKSYLDRGKKKVIPKLEAATQTVTEEELLSQLPEEGVKKVDTSVQVDKIDLNATIKSGKEIACSKNYRKPNQEGNSVVAYSQWLQEIRKEDAPVSTSIKGSERTIIYVPASDERPTSPVIRQLSSSPLARKKNNTSTTHIYNQVTSNLCRKESNDSAVEMFPWGDSTEVKKSPLVRRRSRQSPTPLLLPTDSGTEEMCSLSISLGRIWMDAPQAMAPRSLEMPKSSTSSNPPPAHHSLDSALKDLRDDPLVSNRLHKHSTQPPVTRTLSSTSNNTTSTGLFSSKDSGFSFSISAPRLSDFHANFAPNGSSTKGFFRKKSRPKPKLSVSRDGYFKRTSGALVVETKRTSLRRRSSKKKKNKGKKSKNKERDNGTIRSDIYQVVVSRPQRAVAALKLDPMIFVPPEKRKAGSQKPLFKTKEIRTLASIDTPLYATTRSMGSTDEGLYESLPGDYDYLTDDEEINLESFSMEREQVVEESREITSGYGVVRKYCKRVEEEKKFTKKEERIYHAETKEVDYRDDSRRYQKKGEPHPFPKTLINESTCTYRVPPVEYSEEEDSVSLVSDASEDGGFSVEEEEDECGRSNVYVPPGVSPVPRRRPVRRKKSNGLNHKRSITYLVKPTVLRAPSTLRRPAKKSVLVRSPNSTSTNQETSSSTQIRIQGHKKRNFLP